MDFTAKIAWVYFLVITVLTFIVCGWDKFAAGKQMSRVPEKTLFLLSVFGGSVGMYAAMLTFRHKTQHWYFKFGIPAIIVLQFAILLLLSRLLG